MAFIFCVPWAGTSNRSGTNWIQLAAERGEVPGSGKTFSFFSLYQKSVIWTLISTGVSPLLEVARSTSKGTPGLNVCLISPGARPSDWAKAHKGAMAIIARKNMGRIFFISLTPSVSLGCSSLNGQGEGDSRRL